LVENLSEGKAINENDIPTEVVQISPIGSVLTRIFSKCINKDFYPGCLKSRPGYIIYKSGNRNICTKSTNIYFTAVQ